MTMSGLMRTVSIGIWTAFALVDCSSVHRVAFTREHQDLAGIPGIADARTWADDQAPYPRPLLLIMGTANRCPLTSLHCQAVARRARLELAC
jgi:hypothetical protein